MVKSPHMIAAANMLTPEDRTLWETADEDIKRQHSTFSFDIEKFKSRMTEGDPWQKACP